VQGRLVFVDEVHELADAALVAHRLAHGLFAAPVGDGDAQSGVQKRLLAHAHKNGRKTEVKGKIFPGYVLVDMIATDEAWSIVRNTPQVTGFVGTANQAVPLEQDEVDKILKRAGGDQIRHAIDLARDIDGRSV
jgi:transcription antitermination factor NusG